MRSFKDCMGFIDCNETLRLAFDLFPGRRPLFHVVYYFKVTSPPMEGYEELNNLAWLPIALMLLFKRLTYF